MGPSITFGRSGADSTSGTTARPAPPASPRPYAASVGPALTAIALTCFTVGAIVHEALDSGTTGWLAWPILAAGSIAVATMARYGLVRPLEELVTVERSRRDATRAQLEAVIERRRFVDEIDVALQLAETEADVLGVVGRGLTVLWPERENALLLSPSDEARVIWSVAVSPEGLADPRSLGHATRCSALVADDTMSSESSSQLSACAHLASHGVEVSSLCIPLRIGTGHLGVVHSAGAPGDPPDRDEVDLIEALVAAAGTRIDAIRAEVGSEPAVVCDPLTGLPDHAVAKRAIRDLIGDLVPFSVALCDLDGFATYNDQHGYDRGDRALAAFAEVMCDTLRPGDVIARFGGDKFLAVFPNCTAPNALAAMERIRENLVLLLADLEAPTFTASVGIAHSSQGSSIDGIVEHAEIALLVAKNEGGNRARLANFEMVGHLPEGSA